MAKQASILKSIVILSVAAVLSPMASAQLIPAAFPEKAGKPESLADLIEQVAPSTVNIISIENGTAAEGGSMGQGSGFVITSDGKVVTNYHVIKDADELKVVFGHNKAEFPARIVGTDEETDLAVLQIESEYSFPYVEFYRGKKSIRVGDWVLAVGNPFGIGQSSSVGIISAIGRDAEGSGPYLDYIQTDAVINRGNSGGPLYNMDGKVIAVNSAIYSPTGASVGIGYAIPHDVAENIVYDLVTKGKIERGFFGASLRTFISTSDTDASYKSSGASVEGLVPGGPAQQAGIQIEDLIVTIDGVVVSNSAEATRLIARYRAGQTANFEIFRNNETIQIPVTLAVRPSKDRVEAMAGISSSTSVSQAPTAPATDTGLGLVDLSSSFRDHVGMRRDQVGVYVDTVQPGSNAARKGLKSGMILLEFDNQPIASVAMWENMVAKARRGGKSSVLLKVRTLNGSENYVGLPI